MNTRFVKCLPSKVVKIHIGEKLTTLALRGCGKAKLPHLFSVIVNPVSGRKAAQMSTQRGGDLRGLGAPNKQVCTHTPCLQERCGAFRPCLRTEATGCEKTPKPARFIPKPACPKIMFRFHPKHLLTILSTRAYIQLAGFPRQ